MFVTPGCEIIIIFFNTDGFVGTLVFLNQVYHKIISVDGLGLNIMIGITNDVVIIQPGSDTGAIAVLRSPEPDRLILIFENNQALVDVKRPTVIPRDIIHIGRICNNETIQAFFGHLFFCFV